MTDAEFQAWLSEGGKRVVLVEIGTTPTTYLSSVAYSTLPTDTPSNVMYSPLVTGGVAFSERLSLDGNPSISSGDIEIDNSDGSRDSWLNQIWTNLPVNVYLGDVRWKRSDFKLIFSGVIYSLTARKLNTLNFILRSKLDRLNTPVTEAILGGSSPEADQLLPLTFGECHNVTPLLVNAANHEYQFHNGAAERIIEVRDNGVPVVLTGDYLSTGKFRLAASPRGTITASVQGATSTYDNTVATIIKRLVKNYGTPSERFTDSDIDLDNFDEFDDEHPQPVGVYLSDKSNVLQVCQELASSVGAQVLVSREGLLQLRKVDLPGAGTAIAITPDMYAVDSFQVKERPDVIAGVRLGYCKNWTVQENLETGIPEQHKRLYAREYLSSVVRDEDVAADYKLYAEPEQIDTYLLKGSDAADEAERRLTLWKAQRTVYSFDGFAELLTLTLGHAVTLYHPRYGLSTGKAGIVVGLDIDWITGRIKVEVMV